MIGSPSFSGVRSIVSLPSTTGTSTTAFNGTPVYVGVRQQPQPQIVGTNGQLLSMYFNYWCRWSLFLVLRGKVKSDLYLISFDHHHKLFVALTWYSRSASLTMNMHFSVLVGHLQ